MDPTQLLPRRPYLFKAFYDWILDNELTPYIVVNANKSGVQVPEDYVQDGQIVLNIAPQSVGQYSVSQEAIEFNARFGGSPRHIYVPMAAIEALYARENGVGIGFEPEPQYEQSPAQNGNIDEPSRSKPANNPFHVVK